MEDIETRKKPILYILGEKPNCYMMVISSNVINSALSINDSTFCQLSTLIKKLWIYKNLFDCSFCSSLIEISHLVFSNLETMKALLTHLNVKDCGLGGGG